MPGVLLVPDQVVAVVRDARDQVGAVEHARAVDRVRHRVLRALVVPGVLVLRPDVLEVGQVALVERLDQVGVDHLAQDAGAREDEVEGLTRSPELGEHLVVGGVRRDLDLDAVLGAEVLHHPGRHVLVVVEDLEGATPLGVQAVLDRWVAVLDRQAHRTVGPRQRVGRLTSRGRGAVASAGGQQGGCPHTDSEPQTPSQHLAASQLGSHPRGRNGSVCSGHRGPSRAHRDAGPRGALLTECSASGTHCSSIERRCRPSGEGTRADPAGRARRDLSPPDDPDLGGHATVHYSWARDAGWSSSVARWAHNPEVAGSNPAPATNPRGPHSLTVRASRTCAQQVTSRTTGSARRGDGASAGGKPCAGADRGDDLGDGADRLRAGPASSSRPVWVEVHGAVDRLVDSAASWSWAPPSPRSRCWSRRRSARRAADHRAC